jgi:hypothetical protein
VCGPWHLRATGPAKAQAAAVAAAKPGLCSESFRGRVVACTRRAPMAMGRLSDMARGCCWPASVAAVARDKISARVRPQLQVRTGHHVYVPHPRACYKCHHLIVGALMYVRAVPRGHRSKGRDESSVRACFSLDLMPYLCTCMQCRSNFHRCYLLHTCEQRLEQYQIGLCTFMAHLTPYMCGFAE